MATSGGIVHLPQTERLYWTVLTVLGLLAGLSLALPLGTHFRRARCNGGHSCCSRHRRLEPGHGSMASHSAPYFLIGLVDCWQHSWDGRWPHGWGHSR